MINLGASAENGNSLTFGNDWGGLTAYSFACWIVVKDTPSTANDIFGKFSATADDKCWIIQIDSALKLRVIHHDGSTTATSTVSGTALTIDAIHHIAITWDGSNIDYYLDGAADGTPAFNKAIRAATTAVHLGNRNGGTTGVAADIGEVIFSEASGAQAFVDATRACSARGFDAYDFYFRGLSVDDPEFYGKTTTTVASAATVEHRVGTCAFGFQGNYFKTKPGGSIFKVIDNDEQIVETNSHADIQDKIISNDVELMDGDNNDMHDPSGFREETMSDGTVWKTVYPPFIKRTQWS